MAELIGRCVLAAAALLAWHGVAAEEARGVTYELPSGHLSGRQLMAQCERGAIAPDSRRCRRIADLFDSFGGIDLWAFEIVVREHAQGYHPVATLALEPTEDVTDEAYLESVYEQFESSTDPGAPALSRQRSREGDFERLDVRNAYGAAGVTMSYLVRSREGQRLIVLLPSSPAQPPADSIPASIQWQASSDAPPKPQ